MQNNSIKVWGLAGLDFKGKNLIIEKLKKIFPDDLIIVDLDDLLIDLTQPGREAYRQIHNFFGEEFFDKKGQLKLKKLWKFVYENQNKLKILYFLLDPLLMDSVAKVIDANKHKKILVNANGFIYEHWKTILNGVFWFKINKSRFLSNLDKDLPCLPERYFYILEKVFIKPSHLLVVDLPEETDLQLKQLVDLLK